MNPIPERQCSEGADVDGAAERRHFLVVRTDGIAIASCRVRGTMAGETAGTAVTRRGLLLGAVGATAVAATGASAQTTPEREPTTYTVEMTDDLVFAPDDVTVAPGDTVVWENVGAVGHSVTAYEDRIPEDAEYFNSAGVDAEAAARSAYPRRGDIAEGESYSHTFETEGVHDYFCIPHETVGMVGTVRVVPGGPSTATPAAPVVPANAPLVALATGTVLVVVVALAYFFLKYGGDYGEE